MPTYFLNENDQFLIKDYQNTRPFSSFLPGIAGPMGVPLWVFYVNRGQAITSFGIENKDSPILEYQPANRAYQLTSDIGFRTFVKIKCGNKQQVYEPFRTESPDQTMIVGANELQLREVNHRSHIATEVLYFLLPSENLSGLVRRITLTNLSNKPASLELLDGLPGVIPFGVTNRLLKDIGRTVEAWMEVYNLSQRIPFYRLRASVADTSEVSSFDAGHYMLAFSNGKDGSRLLPVIVDPILVFGNNSALHSPEAFYRQGLKKMLEQKQITCGRTPSGFAAMETELSPGESVQVNSIFGHASCLETIQSLKNRLTKSTFLDEKRVVANNLVHNLTEVIACRTGSLTFDAYCRQTFLDNILRGGLPTIIGGSKEPKVIHMYSRKHGDLERDYNDFSIEPEFYSQGSGSFRDINQNRREDVWFFPEIGDFNIRIFMSLIQADGYNPLVLRGSRFTIPANKLMELLEFSTEPTRLRKVLSQSFSPGSLLKALMAESIYLSIGMQAFLEKVIEDSDQYVESSSTDGYWIDHWTYNLDLIESFLSVYPDRERDLLFSHNNLPFYDSSLVVAPRSKKYVLVDGKPRQSGSVVEDMQKAALISSRRKNVCWVRTGHGWGAVYRTNLFTKLFSLALIKFASLDPEGMGIEMEAGRPGWDDALNGLPGLFGSSMAETYALKWLVQFLREALKGEKIGRIRVPVELNRLFLRMGNAVRSHYISNSNERDFQFWDTISSAREAYRASVRLGLDGTEKIVEFADLEIFLDSCEKKIEEGIARALVLNNGLPPTYFIYQVKEYDLLKDKKGNQKTDPHGRPTIHVKRFSVRPLPLFLEGMVRAMKNQDVATAERLYKRVKASQLFDRKLKMYKINASLTDMPIDIGRARAFTPGWLENESIWLHMEYKYLLEVLRAGLYERFIEDFKNVLIPFLDPKVYGRSPLENSSFLVSSAHPDGLLHGAGFIARLTGASAEFLSIWRIMMAGPRPFYLQNNQLCLAFHPILPGWLFADDNTITYQFLGRARIIYHNPKRYDTYIKKVIIHSIVLHPQRGSPIELSGGVIPAPLAGLVRNGSMKQIEVHFA